MYPGKRPAIPLKSLLTKDILIDLYHNQKMTQGQIGEKFNVTQTGIMYWFRKWNIVARDKDHPIRKKQDRERSRGEKNAWWKGGRHQIKSGYIQVKNDAHVTKRRSKRGYILEHILVWEKHNKRDLPRGWDLHHLNGIKDDNRIENLVVMTSREHRFVIATYKKRILDLENIIRELQEEKNERNC